MKRRYLLFYAPLLAACLIGPMALYTANQPTLNPFPVIMSPFAVSPARNDLVILYSGDRGWEALEKAVSHNLNQRGYGVLGINTLTYFWREQPVADSAAQLDALITGYCKEWEVPRVWLIGYSFGANVLPSIINQLKPQNLARISQLTLLDPTEDVFLEIELGDDMSVGWFNRVSQTYRQARRPVIHHDPFPALLELKGQVPVNCFHSTENAGGLCSQATLPEWVTSTWIDASHTFNRDYDGLTQRLIEQHPNASAGP